jgi:hypothetical protein
LFDRPRPAPPTPPPSDFPVGLAQPPLTREAIYLEPDTDEC